MLKGLSSITGYCPKVTEPDVYVLEWLGPKIYLCKMHHYIISIYYLFDKTLTS